MALTHQEIFNAALLGIRAQGYQQSVKNPDAEYPAWAYLGKATDGQPIACGIGQCVPADKRSEFLDRLDDGAISTILTRNVSQMWPVTGHGMTNADTEFVNYFRSLFEGADLDLLNDVQRAHDRKLAKTEPQRILGFENAMQDIADKYQLTYTEPVAA